MREADFNDILLDIHRQIRSRWIKAGYDENGALIQHNLDTNEKRILTKRVEVVKAGVST